MHLGLTTQRHNTDLIIFQKNSDSRKKPDQLDNYLCAESTDQRLQRSRGKGRNFCQKFEIFDLKWKL